MPEPTIQSRSQSAHKAKFDVRYSTICTIGLKKYNSIIKNNNLKKNQIGDALIYKNSPLYSLLYQILLGNNQNMLTVDNSSKFNGHYSIYLGKDKAICKIICNKHIYSPMCSTCSLVSPKKVRNKFIEEVFLEVTI